MVDGIQRSLEKMSGASGLLMPRALPSSFRRLDEGKLWPFRPDRLKIGDRCSGGDIFGLVDESQLVQHRVMLPPSAPSGRVLWIAPPGDYSIREKVIEIESNDGKKKKEYSMQQFWPIRKPRPIEDTLPPHAPLLVGQRVIDTFFPFVTI